ncbi:phage protein [Desulfoluna butyratoxydans]|uniref:Bacteriophage hp1 orf24 n=1 Tax=Desulfoluna butyratoxydans TaxID=231438 RepID=A0A4U8YMF7_9BACT|nr:phage protein [Desulfoluna butyratoxydans]VFQ42393.1 bacteriophage hp1 orf24 [Desulfoluna butyratoxydans]
MKRISNSSFSFSLGDFRLRAEKASLSIEDGRKSVQDGGVPNGWVPGAVSASGDIELDATAMAILAEEAAAKGSWQGIEPVDLQFYAKGTKEEENVEAFGCLLNLKDIMDYDPTSDKKATVKIGFEVTSPNFVKINGIPYLDPARVEGLTD